jgi:hypothetical protein
MQFESRRGTQDVRTVIRARRSRCRRVPGRRPRLGYGQGVRSMARLRDLMPALPGVPARCTAGAAR